MKIHRGLEGVGDIRNAVVTTGSFDGVHIGHKAILRQLNSYAAASDGESVLITFHPHPRKVLYPETIGKHLFLINSQREKTELLQETGLDHLVIVPFTAAFAAISSLDFIRKILVGILRAKRVVIGFNHHFGHNQEGDLEILKEMGKYHGFQVDEIPEQDIEHESVSSTRIRKAIQEGKIQRANAYLDHYYLIMGRPERLPSHPGLSGFPGYDVPPEEDCKLVPPNGVYAVSFQQEGLPCKGMVLIGDRPENGKPWVHQKTVTLIPFSREAIPGQLPVKILFHKQIRDTTGIPDTELPAGILARDREEIEELIY